MQIGRQPIECFHCKMWISLQINTNTRTGIGHMPRHATPCHDRRADRQMHVSRVQINSPKRKYWYFVEWQWQYHLIAFYNTIYDIYMQSQMCTDDDDGQSSWRLTHHRHRYSRNSRYRMIWPKFYSNTLCRNWSAQCTCAAMWRWDEGGGGGSGQQWRQLWRRHTWITLRIILYYYYFIYYFNFGWQHLNSRKIQSTFLLHNISAYMCAQAGIWQSPHTSPHVHNNKWNHTIDGWMDGWQALRRLTLTTRKPLNARALVCVRA